MKGITKFTLRRDDSMLGNKGRVFHKEGKFLISVDESVMVKLNNDTYKLFKPCKG